MWYEMFEIAVFAALLWGAWRLGVRDGKMLGHSSSAQIAPPVPRPENVVFRVRTRRTSRERTNREKRTKS